MRFWKFSTWDDTATREAGRTAAWEGGEVAEGSADRERTVTSQKLNLGFESATGPVSDPPICCVHPVPSFG